MCIYLFKENNYQNSNEIKNNHFAFLQQIFVKGADGHSLFCTLPMAVKPVSSVVVHQEPVRLENTKILEHLDKSLTSHLKEIQDVKTEFVESNKEHNPRNFRQGSYMNE